MTRWLAGGRSAIIKVMEPNPLVNPDQPAPSQVPADTSSQKIPSHRRRLITLIVLIVLLLVGGLGAFFLTNILPAAHEKTVVGPLKVGTQPFIYPCAVATRAGFAAAFGLSTKVQDYGSMQETSTLLPAQIPAANPMTADLLKLIPHLTDSSMSALCSLDGIKSGAKNPTSIEATFFEYPSPSTAQTAYSNLLTNSKVGATIQPTPVAGLTDSNFLEPPDLSTNNQVASLIFLHSNVTVELDYDPAAGEQLPVTTAEMVAFAKSIGANIDNVKIATT